ncbi:hypothetical protein ACQKL6_15055 [Peribacillus sp. NPDC097197]|uniref:hypothetical protein n=1 Tax=Peribacillus sp. NPDC097197 TaxID=3390615 RepID=UPI003D021A88
MNEKREELHKMIEHLGDDTLLKAWDFVKLLLTKNSGYTLEELKKISESRESIRLGNHITLDEVLKRIEKEENQ